jgi:hypothetical protein
VHRRRTRTGPAAELRCSRPRIKSGAGSWIVMAPSERPNSRTTCVCVHPLTRVHSPCPQAHGGCAPVRLAASPGGATPIPVPRGQAAGVARWSARSHGA